MHRLSLVAVSGGYLLHSMWDLPRPGIEPVSPALAGGFLTTVPPGESPVILQDVFTRKKLPEFSRQLEVSFFLNIVHHLLNIHPLLL